VAAEQQLFGGPAAVWPPAAAAPDSSGLRLRPRPLRHSPAPSADCVCPDFRFPAAKAAPLPYHQKAIKASGYQVQPKASEENNSGGAENQKIYEQKNVATGPRAQDSNPPRTVTDGISLVNVLVGSHVRFEPGPRLGHQRPLWLVSPAINITDWTTAP